MPDEDDTPNHRPALLALLVIAALVAGGWLVTQRLTSSTRTEDCLMQGRRNCMPIDPATGTVQPPK